MVSVDLVLIAGSQYTQCSAQHQHLYCVKEGALCSSSKINNTLKDHFGKICSDFSCYPFSPKPTNFTPVALSNCISFVKQRNHYLPGQST